MRLQMQVCIGIDASTGRYLCQLARTAVNERDEEDVEDGGVR
jgi:hypothetical protein